MFVCYNNNKTYNSTISHNLIFNNNQTKIDFLLNIIKHYDIVSSSLKQRCESDETHNPQQTRMAL